MVIEVRPRIVQTAISGVQPKPSRTKITVFHCFNALNGIKSETNADIEIESIRLPCSSMTREVVLLRAFEAGADAVLVLVCPAGACRHLDGNIRAAKRVERMKKLLDEIGIDGRRLNLLNIPVNDQAVVNHIIDRTVSELDDLGPNPAKQF